MSYDESPVTPPSAHDAAMDAATRLIAAFGDHDTERYFDAFAPDATFLFHSVPGLIESRAAYESIWQRWEKDGFRVLGCRSIEPRIDLITPDVALFTHAVATRVAGEPAEQREWETILFRRMPDGRWLAVHEHLSVDPAPQG